MKAEKLQWALTLANSAKDLIDFLSKTHGNLPLEAQKRLPKLFGWSLDDEQIVDGLIRSLKKKDPLTFEETREFDIDKQSIIFEFLNKKCKNFERNRFINVVAGMEIIDTKPGEEERKWHPTSGQMIYEKIKKPVPGCDRRREFLDAFGTALLSYNDLGLAYNECVGGRMIITDPLHQKVIKSFSESLDWFDRVILAPFKAPVSNTPTNAQLYRARKEAELQAARNRRRIK